MNKTDISAQELGALNVYTENDEAVRLSDLWKKTTAVLVFVRHFGWIFCRQQVAELAESAPRFKKKNAGLVVIGSSESRHFDGFRDATGYMGKLLSDPSRQAFAQLGFSKGITGLMSIKSIPKVFSALKGGHKQGSIQGNTLQLGGAIIVDPSYTVHYYFASKKAGDHPAVEDLLESVDPQARTV